MPWAGSLVKKNTIRPHRVESRILDCFYASWKPACGCGPSGEDGKLVACRDALWCRRDVCPGVRSGISTSMKPWIEQSTSTSGRDRDGAGESLLASWTGYGWD
jgi:hypothetical protein